MVNFTEIETKMLLNALNNHEPTKDNRVIEYYKREIIEKVKKDIIIKLQYLLLQISDKNAVNEAALKVKTELDNKKASKDKENLSKKINAYRFVANNCHHCRHFNVGEICPHLNVHSCNSGYIASCQILYKE